MRGDSTRGPSRGNGREGRGNSREGRPPGPPYHCAILHHATESHNLGNLLRPFVAKYGYSRSCTTAVKGIWSRIAHARK